MFTEDEFISMTYNKNFDLLYVLTKTFNVLVLNANNFNEVDRFALTSNPFEFSIPLLAKFELPRKIVFSENNSNVYYLQTTKNVYKYFINTQSKNIEKKQERNKETQKKKTRRIKNSKTGTKKERNKERKK